MNDGSADDHGDLVTGGGRTLDELKQEVLRRVERGLTPVTGIKVEDARSALSSIDSLSREQWAQAWSAVAERHYAAAQAAESTDPERAAQSYWNAWRLHHFARWPTENTPAKRHAKERALIAFRAYARLLRPAIDVIRIPFEGKEIVAYLRLPERVRPAPIVLGISGLDSRKEDVVAHTDGYLKHGLAIMAVDMPGTGESPIAAARPDSDRVFSAVIDYLQTRPEVDAKRILVQGRSFSGHWAAKLAYTERTRLRGCVVHGGGVHKSFQRAWAEPALKTGEYLYDYLEARRGMVGASDAEDLYRKIAGFSLMDQGLVDQPSAPMLVVNGWLDSQTTCEDVFVLLQHGDAKDAWVNPKGRHMGRSAEWPGSRIQEEVLMPWMLKHLQERDS
ncbi:MAG: alpha/beta hydrolase [Methanocella sp.]